MKKNYSLIFLGVFFIKALNAYISFREPTEALKIAAQYLPENPVILEAGAYDGKETVHMLHFFKNKAKIYSFEPIPYLYDVLKKHTCNYAENIRTYQMALSDTEGQAAMYVSEEVNKPDIPSQSSSLLAPKAPLSYAASVQFKKQIFVETTTIDSWAQKNGVEKIDLMWLDMQGYELNALKASPNILKTVKVILTEVEFVEAYKGQYLFDDVKKWLEEQGFTMIAENFDVYKWFGDALFVRL